MRSRSALSPREMRHQIARLNRIRADVSDFTTIKQIYGDIFTGVHAMTGATNPQDLFFRARVSRTKLSRVSDIDSPPPELVTGYQRCNAPGMPMFYCSSRRSVALQECRALEGDTVYLSQWIGRDRLPINKAFHAERERLFERISEAENTLYTHLDTIFTRRIHATFSNDYKFSAAVSQQMTSNFPPDQMYIAEDGAIGLLYPSVFEMEDACNYAFPPHFTLDRIELLHVMELRVERIRDGVIKVTLLDTAIDFDDGELQWTGNRLCIPAPRPPEKGVLFRADGERWRVLTIEHLPEIDVPPDVYLAALLLE